MNFAPETPLDEALRNALDLSDAYIDDTQLLAKLLAEKNIPVTPPPVMEPAQEGCYCSRCVAQRRVNTPL